MLMDSWTFTVLALLVQVQCEWKKKKCSLTSTSRMNTSFPVSEIYMFLVFLSVVAMKLCKELLMRRLIHVRTFHVGFIKINCALACHD